MVFLDGKIFIDNNKELVNMNDSWYGIEWIRRANGIIFKTFDKRLMRLKINIFCTNEIVVVFIRKWIQLCPNKFNLVPLYRKNILKEAHKSLREILILKVNLRFHAWFDNSRNQMWLVHILNQCLSPTFKIIFYMFGQNCFFALLLFLA